MSTIETCNETLVKLGAENFPEEAKNLLLAATARQRHESRVEATLSVVKGTRDPEWSLLLDIHGKGGPFGAGGGTSQRSVLFAGLGSGRWNARDGQAFKAAGLAALRRMLETNHIEVEAQPEEGDEDPILCLHSEKVETLLSRGGLERHYLSEDMDVKPLVEAGLGENILALIRHGLLVSTKVWPDGEDIKFRGAPETWALLLERWTKAIADLDSAEAQTPAEVQEEA